MDLVIPSHGIFPWKSNLCFDGWGKKTKEKKFDCNRIKSSILLLCMREKFSYVSEMMVYKTIIEFKFIYHDFTIFCV